MHAPEVSSEQWQGFSQMALLVADRIYSVRSAFYFLPEANKMFFSVQPAFHL